MIKNIFYIFLFILSLEARENPFEESETFKYEKSLIKEIKTEDLINKIEEQNQQKEAKDILQIQKEVEKHESINKSLEKIIPIIKPKEEVQNTQKLTTKKIFSFIKISYNDDKIILESKNKLKKIFTIPIENKIVVDYRAYKNFYTKRVDLDSKIFSKITIGNHKERRYYRAVIKVISTPKDYKIIRQKNKIIISKKQ